MQQRILNLVEQIKNMWIGLGQGKQIRVSLTALVVLLAMGATIYMLTRPNMVIIENQMSPATLYSAISALEAGGIRCQPEQASTALAVEEKDVDKARLLLGSQGILVKTSPYEDAFKAGMGTTEKTRTQMMIQAKQREIEESIKAIYNVSNAQVILNVPDRTPFVLETADPARASVTLNLKSEMSSMQAEALANHVANSVEGLEAKNVSIVDTKGNPLYQVAGGAAGAISAQAERELNEKKKIEDQAKATFSHLYERIEAVAALKYDWSSSSEVSRVISPAVEGGTSGFVKRSIEEDSTVSNTDGSTEPGLQANNQQVPEYEINGGATSDAQKSTKDTEYDYSEATIKKEDMSLKVLKEESSIAVTAYITKTYEEDVLRKNGTLNNEMTWEDYKTSIRSTPVRLDPDPDAIEAVSKATGIPVENITVQRFQAPVFIDTVKKTRPIDQLLMAGLLLLIVGLLAFGLIKRTQPEPIADIEPELEVEKLIVTGKNAEAETAPPMEEIDYFADSEIKKLIDKFVNEKPESAAALLRNWLSDEWE